MKRLSFKDFKTKSSNQQPVVAQLLHQILGDCHDSNDASNGSGNGSTNGHWDNNLGG